MPSTLTAIREKLSLRLKQLVQMTSDYEKKIRGVEIKLEYGLSYVWAPRQILAVEIDIIAARLAT